MLESHPYVKRERKELVTITELYTTAEVKEKYGVVDSWIFAIAKKNNIPRTFHRGKTFWSKKHIDKYFEKKAPNPDITEWYSVSEIQVKFGMSTTAIYTFVNKNLIPRKKIGNKVWYSKKHIEIAKGLSSPEEPQYYTILDYTILEAMTKFNLTRDQVYQYSARHNIPKIKAGRYVKISKPDLDRILSPPTIQSLVK